MISRRIRSELLSRVNRTCILNRFYSSNANNSDDVEKRRRFFRQSQGLRAFRPEEYPQDPSIILFPGQGSQFVGMAKSLENIIEARELFDIASEILRFLSHISSSIVLKRAHKMDKHSCEFF